MITSDRFKIKETKHFTHDHLFEQEYLILNNFVNRKYQNSFSCKSPQYYLKLITSRILGYVQEGNEDAHVADSRGPIGKKNQKADSFHACSVCNMDYFSKQMSLFQGVFTKT